MIRRRMLGNIKYINPLDPAVDLDAWDDKKRSMYMKTNFELPPIKKGETPVIWEFRQLTGEQIFEADSAAAEYGLMHPQYIKTVLERTLVDWSGLEIEDTNGNIKEFRPDTYDTPTGKRLKKENYYELMGFFSNPHSEATMTSLIYTLSLP